MVPATFATERTSHATRRRMLFVASSCTPRRLVSNPPCLNGMLRRPQSGNHLRSVKSCGLVAAHRRPVTPWLRWTGSLDHSNGHRVHSREHGYFFLTRDQNGGCPATQNGGQRSDGQPRINSNPEACPSHWEGSNRLGRSVVSGRFLPAALALNRRAVSFPLIPGRGDSVMVLPRASIAS